MIANFPTNVTYGYGYVYMPVKVSGLAPRVRILGSDEVDGAEYWYGDRIPADYDRIREAADRAQEEVGTTSTARFFETKLRLAVEDPDLQLVHLMTGVNRGNGFPYHVYGVMRGQQPEAPAPTGNESTPDSSTPA